jgi:cell division protein FtsQ
VAARVTGPSGSSREGESSRYGAAGASPAPGPKAVYGEIASAEPEIAGSLIVPVAKPAARAQARRPKSGPRRRSWRAAFFGLALAGLVAFAAWALFDSRLLVVRSVVVVGTHTVPSSEVLAAAGVELGTPLIRVNTGPIAARVDTIRQVLSVQVSRSWPDRVVIVIHERTPAVAVTAPGGGFDLVDGYGVIVRWAARQPAGLPLYPATAGVAALQGDPDLAAAAAVLRTLPAPLLRTVRSVTAPSPDQVTLQLSGGITVVWGGTDRTAAKARELTVLMRTHSHYYDVSAPGTLITK